MASISGQEVNDLGYLLPSISKGNIHCEGDLHLGSEEDGFSLSFDGTNTLNIDPENANDTIRVGETTLADVQLDGATYDILWDNSADELIMSQASQRFGAASDGVVLIFDGSDTLNIDPANANDVVRIGETTLADFRVDVTTATKDFIIDASADLIYGAPYLPTYTATTDSTAGNNTITIAQILTGLYNRDCNGSARTDTLPTAALAVAGCAQASVGTTLHWYITNTSDAAETLTIAAGTGGTMLGGASLTVAQNESAHIVINFTNVTASSEAYDVWAMTSATE